MEATKAPLYQRVHDSQHPQAASFRTGDIVGAYKIVSLIGKGGSGQVFKAEHTVTRRIEAIKVLSGGRTDTQEEAQRFLREIQIHASLSHPNIASVHNAFWVGEDLVMAMEFVDGESLRRILERGRIPLSTAIDHFCQALTALAYAHANRVIHRDITPGNMLVTATGGLKLTDFGLAKLPTDLGLTHSGMMVGSLYYMSPEQVRAIPEVDPRMDIYSMGAVFYEAVTGVKPFDGDSAFSIMLAHVGQDPPTPISLEPALPAGLSEIILKALSKDPKDRFQSAEEFRLALEPFRERENESRTSRACEAPVLLQPAHGEHGQQNGIESNRAAFDSLLKRCKHTAKKFLQSALRAAQTSRPLQWGYETSTTCEDLGKPAVTSTGLAAACPPANRSWFAVAASVLVLACLVLVTGVKLPARHTLPPSVPATTELRIPLQISPESARVRISDQDLGVVRELKLPKGSHDIEIFLEGYEPQRTTIPVTASGAAPVPAIVLRPLPTILKMNMPSGNATLNDEPIQLQAGLSSHNLLPGDYSLQLIRDGRGATVQFRVTAAGMPEVTEISAGKINVTAVALFGKKARVHQSGKSNFLEITDLQPGPQIISSAKAAGATEFDIFDIDVGDAPSLQVFMNNPETREKVQLQKGKAQTSNSALIRSSATVAVIDAPDDKILVNGAPKGTVPLAKVHVTITPKHSRLIAVHEDGQPQPLKEGSTWLQPGDYKIVARSPGFVDEVRTLSLKSNDDVRLTFALAEKLSEFKATPPIVRTIRDLGGSWAQDNDGWWNFSGPDKYALLNLKPEGRLSFQVQRKKTGPIKFISKEKSSWVAFFVDAKNHLLFELEAGQLTISEVLHGTKKLKRRIPVEKESSHIELQLSARRALLSIGNAAHLETAPDQSLIGGKFGFKGPAVIKDFSLVSP